VLHNCLVQKSGLSPSTATFPWPKSIKYIIHSHYKLYNFSVKVHEGPSQRKPFVRIQTNGLALTTGKHITVSLFVEHSVHGTEVYRNTTVTPARNEHPAKDNWCQFLVLAAYLQQTLWHQKMTYNPIVKMICFPAIPRLYSYAVLWSLQLDLWPTTILLKFVILLNCTTN